MKLILLRIMSLVALVTPAPPVLAQVPPAERPSSRLVVEWDSLGPFEPVFENPYHAEALATDVADTLYAATGDGIYRLAPDAEVWSGQLFRLGTNANARSDDLVFTAAGDLLADVVGPGVDNAIHRFSDGGRTWEGVYPDRTRSLETTRTGAVFGGLQGAAGDLDPNDFVASRDNGDTWAGDEIGSGSGWGNAFVELPAGPPTEDGTPAWPENRIVAAVFDGIATSDDGGQTWAPSSLWGHFTTIGFALAVPPDGAPAPVLAIVEGPDGMSRLYASTDGGQTWAEHSPLGFLTLRGNELVWDEHGLWAGLRFGDTGAILHSADEGRTWTEVDWPGYGVFALAFASRRVLYVATPVGVFRSRSPVSFPVASEDGAPGGPVAELGIPYPNPSDGSTTVPIVLTEGASAHVAVFDALGREVVVLHEGPLAAGTRRSVSRARASGMGSTSCGHSLCLRAEACGSSPRSSRS